MSLFELDNSYFARRNAYMGSGTVFKSADNFEAFQRVFRNVRCAVLF